MQIFQAVGLVVEIENVISTLVVIVIGFRLDIDASVEMLVQRVVDSRTVVDLTESIVHKMDVLCDMGSIDIEAVIYSIGVKIQDVEANGLEQSAEIVVDVANKLRYVQSVHIIDV